MNNIITNNKINYDDKLGLIYTKLFTLINNQNKNLQFQGLPVDEKIKKLLELYTNKINGSIKNKIIDFIEKQKSKVDVYIYEVKGPDININDISNHLNKEFYFKNISIKKNTNSKNSLIIPNKNIGLFITKINSNNSKIFSQNIIKNKNSDNNEELNMNINDISFLYKIYKNYSARNKNMEISKNKTVKSTIYNNINSLLNKNIKILTKFYEFNNFIINLKNQSDENFLGDTSEIIYNLKDNGKIIVFGDNHGSFHSFFRIILRFYIQGIISKNYKLKDDYKIILLGDVIDRGVYCIELLYIILKLMISNNTEKELKVIIIRGNHEELITFTKYGFANEVKKKLISNNYIDKFNNFFKLCPSAIILEHRKTRYWLAHGGFNINDISLYKENLKNKIFKIDNNKISQIRWNDFYILSDSKVSLRYKSSDSEIYNIGLNDLYKFLNELNINFIIRGHTDKKSNAMLLSLKKIFFTENNLKLRKEKYLEKDFFFKLNERENYDKIKKNEQNIIQYCNIENNTKKCNDKIVSIVPLHFINDKNINIKISNNKFTFITKNNNKKYPCMKIEDEIIFPVLTISNNSDKDRDLYSDSYVIIN